MSVPRAAAVNVDIDSLVHYHRIHGLPEAAATDAAWERGVPRFAELFAELDVKATFFVVAQDLDRSAPACAMVSQLARDGHEIASHSWSHPYDLTRWTPEALAGELDRARVLLEEVAGRPIVGFRSPGYTLTEGLLGLLRDRGYAYDSSLFPCPPYYLAKAAVMARMRLGGRVCQAILGDPRDAFTRRLLPHHRQGLLELPITVLPGLRVPIIGTSLFMLGARGYRLARPWLARRAFVNLELHAIDLCDLAADGLDPALGVEPALRVDLSARRALLRRVVADLRQSHGVRTLADVAAAG